VEFDPVVVAVQLPFVGHSVGAEFCDSCIQVVPEAAGNAWKQESECSFMQVRREEVASAFEVIDGLQRQRQIRSVDFRSEVRVQGVGFFRFFTAIHFQALPCQVQLSKQALEALQTRVGRIDDGGGDFVGDSRHRDCFVGIGF
jgi:hypothetical protein